MTKRRTVSELKGVAPQSLIGITFPCLGGEALPAKGSPISRVASGTMLASAPVSSTMVTVSCPPSSKAGPHGSMAGSSGKSS